VIEDFLCCH